MSPQEKEIAARMEADVAKIEAARLIERDLKKKETVSTDGDDREMDFLLSNAGICPYW